MEGNLNFLHLVTNISNRPTGQSSYLILSWMGSYLDWLPGHVPDLDVSVLSRRAEGGVVHPADSRDLGLDVCRGEDVVLCRVFHTPNDESTIKTTGGHELAIGREGQAVYLGCVEAPFLER